MCKGLADDCAVVSGDGNAARFGIPENSPSYIKVWRNGTQLIWGTPAGPNVFTFTDNGNGVITFGEDLQKGDVIKVTLKTGDAPEETITVTVK